MAETRDDRGSHVRRPPRTRGRWWILTAAVLLAVTVAAGGVPWLLSDPGRMSRLAANALPEVDGVVTFQAVWIGWAGPILLEGIRVVPRDGAAPPLSIARIEVSNGLAAIIGSGGDLGRVRVEGLEADVVFDERHRSNLSGLFRPAPEDAPSPKRSRRRGAVRMRLEVEDAIVRIAGPTSPEPWNSMPIDVSATLGPAADGVGSEWTIEPVDILADARLEPNFAREVLTYIAPVLEGRTRPSGRFSLRLDGARLPVGRPADGTLAGTLTMHEVVLGPENPIVEILLGWLTVRLPAPPAIRIVDGSRVAFQLADRRVAHDGLEFGVPLGQAGQRLDIRSSGTVAIDDGALDLVLRLPIPADLPIDRPILAALAGKSVSIGIRGTLDHPRVVFDGSIGGAAVDFAGDLIDRLRTDPNLEHSTPGEPAVGNGTADAVIDIVGGIFEGIAKLRAERQAGESGNPEAPPPRRPRERRRGGLGPAGDR